MAARWSVRPAWSFAGCRAVGIGALGLALVCWFTPVRADAVDDWGQIALDAVVADSPDPGHATHTMATVYAAMFEALNFFDGPYAPRFTTLPTTGWGAVSSPEVAAVAAHQILLLSFPQRSAVLDEHLQQLIAATGTQPPRPAILIAARNVANIVWAVRGLAVPVPVPVPTDMVGKDSANQGLCAGNHATRPADTGFRGQHAAMIAFSSGAGLPHIARAQLLADCALAAEQAAAARSSPSARRLVGLDPR